MATEILRSVPNQHSDYEKLASEYKARELHCRASLDQLQAAERQLEASALEFDRDIDANASADIKQILQEITSRNSALNAEGIHKLSHRERNVFELIGQGLPTGAIAECLCVSVSTVETYRED